MDGILIALASLDAASEALIREWYVKDLNAQPVEYVLKKRTGQFEQYEYWEPIERRLRDGLRLAAKDCLPPVQANLVGASATELEIVNGYFKAGDASSHVFGFFREIPGLRGSAAEGLAHSIIQAAPHLLDIRRDGTWDKESHARLIELRQTLENRLGDHAFSYSAPWAANLDLAAVEKPESKAVGKTSKFPPGGLCEAVWNRLSDVLTQEMDAMDRISADPIETEREAHGVFGLERFSKSCKEVSRLGAT